MASLQSPITELQPELWQRLAGERPNPGPDARGLRNCGVLGYAGP